MAIKASQFVIWSEWILSQLLFSVSKQINEKTGVHTCERLVYAYCPYCVFNQLILQYCYSNRKLSMKLYGEGKLVSLFVCDAFW